MNLWIARVLIVSVIVLLLIVSLVPIFTTSENRSKEIVALSTLACVVETCVTTSTEGKDCTELKPKLSKVKITLDANKYQHINVEPTNIECK